MSQTVADTLVGVLEEIGVKHIFGLIGIRSIRLPTRFVAAALNGSASGTRKAQRSPPPAKPNSPGG
jgi:hypothetical protein